MHYKCSDAMLPIALKLKLKLFAKRKENKNENCSNQKDTRDCSRETALWLYLIISDDIFDILVGLLAGPYVIFLTSFIS